MGSALSRTTNPSLGKRRDQSNAITALRSDVVVMDRIVEEGVDGLGDWEWSATEDPQDRERYDF